jgi:MOSC domain-containing protein YiiM
MNSGELVAIWIKRMKLGPMDPVSSAILTAGRGIKGNANQGGKRQVTIIHKEAWEELTNELKASIPPSTRRANLMVSGVMLANTRNRILRVGGCRIKILGETRPCERMDEAFEGLRKAMDPNWYGGVYGEVLDDGSISIGDKVSWEPVEQGPDR